MYCPQCNAELADDSEYCTECGADAHVQTTREAAERAKASEKLLATANLWRMRGKWSEAERSCVEVMRADPNNLHAHSLLGDIYRDQGRYDDAAQWYQMALDLDAGSTADRAKLDHVKAEIARVEARAPRPRIASTVDSVGTQALMGLSPNNWLRALVGASVVFVALVVVLVVAMSKPAPKSGDKPAARPPAVPTSPSNSVQPLNVPLPPAEGPGVSSVRPPRQRDDNDEAAPLSEREVALDRAIGSRAALTCSTLEACAIQRDGASALVILNTTPTQVDSAETLRGIIHSEARKAADAVLAADAGLSRVAVRVRTPGRGGHLDTAFQATLDRPADGAAEATDFGSVWWAPEIRP